MHNGGSRIDYVGWIIDYVKWLCGCIWFSCLVNHWWLKASFSHPMQWKNLYKFFRVCWTWIHCYHSKISEVTWSQFVMLFHVVSSRHHGEFVLQTQLFVTPHTPCFKVQFFITPLWNVAKTHIASTTCQSQLGNNK